MYVADETTDDKFGSKLAKDRLDISVPGGSTFDVVTSGGVPHAATTMAAANAATANARIPLLRLGSTVGHVGRGQLGERMIEALSCKMTSSSRKIKRHERIRT